MQENRFLGGDVKYTKTLDTKYPIIFGDEQDQNCLSNDFDLLPPNETPEQNSDSNQQSSTQIKTGGVGLGLRLNEYCEVHASFIYLYILLPMKLILYIRFWILFLVVLVKTRNYNVVMFSHILTGIT